MARIIGGSGSTDHLKNKLRKIKLDGLDNFEDIKSFKDNFPQLLQQKQIEEKAKLTHEIDTLKSNSEKLNIKLQESIESHKIELQIKKEGLIAQIDESNGSPTIKDNSQTQSAKRQLKKLETKFDKIAEKPFKKDKKQISKIKK